MRRRREHPKPRTWTSLLTATLQWALAMLTGAGWRAQWVSVPGLPASPGRNVVLAGVRDLEPYQRWRLEASEVRVVAGAIDSDQLATALDELARRVGRVNLHVDVDALGTRPRRTTERRRLRPRRRRAPAGVRPAGAAPRTRL